MNEPGSAQPRRIGIFGGTFNPIHVGHLRAAEEVRELVGLDEMRFVPSADPPLKRGGSQLVAPAKRRADWVAAAIADHPDFVLDPLELEPAREGPSYTVDTLEILHERLAPAELVFVIGRDAFVELPMWRSPERLLTLASFAVMTRPPLTGGGIADWLPEALAAPFEFVPDGAGSTLARHRTRGTWLRRVEISALDVSATDLRRRLREGRSIRYLVPESVRETIVSSRCYEDATSE